MHIFERILVKNVYIHMRTCVEIHIPVWICTRAYMHACAYIYIAYMDHAFTYINTCIYVHTYMYVHIREWVCECVCVYKIGVCVCTYIHTHTHWVRGMVSPTLCIHTCQVWVERDTTQDTFELLQRVRAQVQIYRAYTCMHKKSKLCMKKKPKFSGEALRICSVHASFWLILQK
jgi:hypothetical protein